VQDGGQVGAAGEAQLGPDLVAGRAAGPPPVVDLRGDLARRPGHPGRQQRGELAPAVVVVHRDELAAGPQHAHGLGQPGVGTRREEVGEPGVHHVGAAAGQPGVLGRPGSHLDRRPPGTRQFGRGPLGPGAQAGRGLDADDPAGLLGVPGQPEPGAAAQVDYGLPGPWRQSPQRVEHVAGLVQGPVLGLVDARVPGDVRRVPPVGKGRSRQNAARFQLRYLQAPWMVAIP
jgi:hypothetical protein